MSTSTITNVIMFALFIGVIAGLRTMTPVAVVSWAAYLGTLQLQGTGLAFLGFAATPYIVTVLALGELINDKLPKTPSRKEPAPFGARIVVGAFCGAALGLASQALVGGIIAGAIGAVIGTFAGAAARGRLARAFGKDLPAALLEDFVAIAGSIIIVSRFG